MCSGAEPEVAEAAVGSGGAAKGAGAVAGSEAAANAVGAAGGDAIGSLIASNATNWGLSVSPDIAGLGMSAGAGVLNGLKTAATILSPAASIISAASGLGAAGKNGLIRPNVPPLTTMPISGSPTAFSAQQASLASQALRRGRAATILTSPDGQKLGQ